MKIINNKILIAHYVDIKMPLIYITAIKMPGVVAQMPKGKTYHYGIEVADKLTWQGWEPGREYTQTIVLKNVKVKTQKLKFK